MGPSLRVLHVIPNLLKGGAERLVLDIARYSNRHPKMQAVVAVFEEGDAYPWLSESIRVVHTPVETSFSMRGKSTATSASFERLLDEFKPDVVHSHLYRAELAVRLMARNDIRYVCHLHSSVPALARPTLGQWFSRSGLGLINERRLLLRAYKANAPAFVAIAQASYDHVAAGLPAYQKRLRLIHNAIDLDAFAGVARTQPKAPLRLAMIGRFFDYKNHAYLVHVMEDLRERGIEARLKLVGDGPERESVIALASSLGLADVVDCTGLVDDIPELLRATDVYVHSSLYEPFGLTLVEGMAAGCPVVALDGGGNKDIITQGTDGILLDAKASPKAFADAICQVSEPSRYARMSQAAIERSKLFGMTEYTEKLYRFYTEVAMR